MPLGVISRVSFGFWGDFWRKIAKEKPEKSGQNGLLRRSVRNPRRGVALRRSMGCLAMVRPRCPKGYPSGMLQHSFATPQQSATPRCRHYSQREKF